MKNAGRRPWPRSLTLRCSAMAPLAMLGARLLILAATVGCSPEDKRNALVNPSAGDATRGAEALKRYGCGSCHFIQGISGADGRVGPPLHDLGRRAYLAGMLPNTPDNLVRWITDPQSIDPKTAMPDLAVSEAEAQDMAVYLFQPST